MTIHKGPPPGTLTIPQVCKRIGRSKQTFYSSGLADLLDSWQVSANTPRLYLREDVGKLAYWLFVREGQIALSAIPATTPLKPDFDLDAWFEEDLWGGECPDGHRAVVDPDDGRGWCKECGGLFKKSKLCRPRPASASAGGEKE